MAGNILSRALLSIFMDKNARQKYDALQSAKKAKKGDAPPPAAPVPTAEKEDDPLGDVLPETLVRQAINAAASELERRKSMPPGRQALIEQALSIHDQKKKLIDDLPEEQREKLIVMAMHAFGADLEKKPAGAGKSAAKKAPKPVKKRKKT